MSERDTHIGVLPPNGSVTHFIYDESEDVKAAAVMRELPDAYDDAQEVLQRDLPASCL